MATHLHRGRSVTGDYTSRTVAYIEVAAYAAGIVVTADDDRIVCLTGGTLLAARICELLNLHGIADVPDDASTLIPTTGDNNE